MSSLGWRGKQVRHLDGRLGVISKEFIGHGHVSLHIEANNGSEAVVILDARSSDSGANGWAWLCENFSAGPHWLPLGDHNGFPAASATAEQTA